MLTTANVTKMLRINRHSLMKIVEAGGFPQPIRLNARTYRWNEETVASWLREKEQCSTKTSQA
ncbi:helix-turn-helix transcriptional regulator [Methylobacterium soli]|nr:AlpA family phage regulatory protein [Methylobacterium soli]